ncbi:MAG: hypothetical protein AYK22_04410 [Thermoplasmatales archaeon SG8-52-3]|nr:MAG: hypothetical protein AYK22_04410 [Thermoplasmatales archaeon SG8-52-3]
MKDYRHLLIEDWDQEKLDNTTVLLAGAGAVGSQTAIALARLGVKTIVVDSDVLEEHNLGNQAYSRRHLGLSKVDALKSIVKEISDVEFIAIKSLIENLKFDNYKIDVLLGALDNIGARYYLNAVAVFSGKPYIDAGIEGYAGSVRTILPHINSCMQCWPSIIKERKVRPSCSQDPIPSVCITAGHASNFQVMQLLNFLFGKEVSSFITFDLQRGIANPINLNRNKECELCGTIPSTG